MHYYMQSAKGHLDILNDSQNIEELIANNNLDTDIHNKLALILQVREFAANTLYLSFNDSYTSYVNLNRDYAVNNLFAAEEFSTQLYSWCYPVIGCANYRGYFDEQMLLEYRDDLNSQDYDTYVVKVAAYSTLGWFEDPVLSNFLDWPEYRLVGLIFHELAHQQLYINDDTFFNESFAMAVEQAGLEQWYSGRKNSDQLEKYRENQKRNDTVITLASLARTDLNELYQQPVPDTSKRQQKEKIIQHLQQQYALLAENWGNKSNVDVLHNGEINNASLGIMAAYHKFVPAFLSILKSHNNDFQSFYSHVYRLSELTADNRQQCLLAWAKNSLSESKTIPLMCQAESG